MPKKTNGYNHSKADARKNKKRQEAEARQRAYDKLTIAEKMTLALKRGGSKKEIARLDKAKKVDYVNKLELPPAPGVEVKPAEAAAKPNRRERRKATAKS